MEKVYVARFTKANVLAQNHVGCWASEYQNAYAGRTWLPVPDLVDATLYSDPGLDGMLDKIRESWVEFEIEVIEMTLNVINTVKTEE